MDLGIQPLQHIQEVGWRLPQGSNNMEPNWTLTCNNRHTTGMSADLERQIQNLDSVWKEINPQQHKEFGWMLRDIDIAYC